MKTEHSNRHTTDLTEASFEAALAEIRKMSPLPLAIKPTYFIGFAKPPKARRP